MHPHREASIHRLARSGAFALGLLLLRLAR
jgi:hypothetical protein